MNPKDRGAMSCKREAATLEMMYKQHQGLVDGIRAQGKKSTNMLVRIAMMNENPMFADSLQATMPSSISRVDPKVYTFKKEKNSVDMVKGGSGENLYLVSRGVSPAVIPAKYNTTYDSTTKSSYGNHFAKSSKLYEAKHPGDAQAQDWQEASLRRKELESEMQLLDNAIMTQEQGAHVAATGHGLYGRMVPESSSHNNKNNSKSSTLMYKSKMMTQPKGLSAKGGTTMKDSFVEHPLRLSKKLGVCVFDHDDERNQLNSRDNKNIGSPIKTIHYGGQQRRIPTNPAALGMKQGSNVYGSAFQWRDTQTHSSKSDDYSWPQQKLSEYDVNTEKRLYTHKYGNYDISSTRYGDCARECDLVRGSIYTVPKSVLAAEKAKRMHD